MHICEVEYKGIQRPDGCDIITRLFAQKGGRLYDYGSTPLHCYLVIQDAGPKIVDAPLTLIFRR
jgi:hypothetical protein